ncbi:hypothetical protein HNP84_008062 [Thermocatellispora tengchongensis]|uniref:DUF998 domain-containing protein n=1 Tax=Thermocatellispora tengchongensis TaxID=1073253 RepID=A0A840PH59_9ACTN|nr:DUF998 domain-containing protein [Thermocatellispora tengchongensis]MBB5138309.1 hypothetical protein [Thermocatellispora tengchongensis]
MTSLASRPGAPGEASALGPLRVWAWLGAAGPVVALGAMAYAHLAASASVSPLTGLVSEYALDPGAYGGMLAATLALAMGCLWVTFGLAQADPARTAATRVLLVAVALGLVLTAIFPTDPTPGVTSMGGEIHRWSAAVVFTGLPCAALALTRNRPAFPRRVAIRGTAVAGALLLAAFLAAHPGSPLADLIAGPAYHGLLQRLLLVTDALMVLLIALSLTAKRPTG